MYDDILIPTDGSAAVDRALTHALNLAEVHDASVHGLFVINSTNFASLPMETSWEGISDILREDAREALDAISRRAESRRVPVDTAILEGSPSNEIVRYARDSGIDLIVMGTQGRSGIDRWLIGSVTERVVRTAPIPVLTVQLGADQGIDQADSESTQSQSTTSSADR